MPHPPTRRAGRAAPTLAAAGLLLALAGCAATTTLTLTPAPQPPVCDASARARVLWLPQWRPDQKDVAARDAAAADGLARFVRDAGCFASATLQRLAGRLEDALPRLQAEAGDGADTVVLITVRELGPTLVLGASPALVDGATEVRLEVTVSTRAQPLPRSFGVQWRHGGPGIVKGVATLAQDMHAALAAALQPPVR